MERANGREATTSDVAWNLPDTAGRFLYSVPFLVFGAMHLMQGGAMAGVVPDWLPGGAFWVYATGVANFAAGVAVAAGRYVRWAVAGLVALLGAYIVTVHVPGLFSEASFQMALQSLLKDVGLAGGALLVLNTAD